MHSYNERDYSGLRWDELSWVEIERCAEEGRIVLIPLGSIEQHGPMLPVGCDRFLARTWAMEGARRSRDKYGVKILVIPTIPYGVSTEHIDFSGTISLDLTTYIRLLQDVIREIVRAGFRKIVCVSGHGGNIMPAQVTLRDLKARFKKEKVKGIKLYMADSKNCFVDDNKVYKKMKQGQFNFHADAVETSYYMFHRPDLVKKEGLVKPELKRQSMPLGSWWTKDITETGASGDASKANPEYGKEIYRYFPDALALFLKKVSED